MLQRIIKASKKIRQKTINKTGLLRVSKSAKETFSESEYKKPLLPLIYKGNSKNHNYAGLAHIAYSSVLTSSLVVSEQTRKKFGTEMRESNSQNWALLLFLLLLIFFGENAYAEEKKEGENAENTSSNTDRNKWLGLFDLKKFEEFFLTNYQEKTAKSYKNIKGKEVVFVIGLTGAGKSASINYLLGSKLELYIDKDGMKKFRICEGEKEYAKIGLNPNESETIFAEFFSSDKSAFAYCDCPGFYDTRKEYIKLVSADLSTELAIKQQDAIKGIIVVVDGQMLRGPGRGKLVKDLVEILSNSLKIRQDSEKLKESILFLFTHKDKVEHPVNKNSEEMILDLVSEHKIQIDKDILKALFDLNIQVAKNKLNELWENFGNKKQIQVLTPEVRARLIELFAERKIYEVIENNSIVVDMADKGETKEKIDRKIKQFTGISKNAFQFNPQDSSHIKFNYFIENASTEGKNVTADLLEFYNRIVLSNKKLNFEKSRLVNYEAAKLEAAKPKEIKAEMLDKYGKQRQVIQERLNNLATRQKVLTDELNEIRKEDLVPYWKEFVYEERGLFGGLLFGWTEKEFIYNDMPYEEAKPNWKNGKFIIKKKNKEEGSLHCIYQSDYRYPGEASVEVLVKKKDLPGNPALIKQIERDLKSIEQEIPLLKDQQVEITNKERSLLENFTEEMSEINIKKSKEIKKALKIELVELNKKFSETGAEYKKIEQKITSVLEIGSKIDIRLQTMDHLKEQYDLIALNADLKARLKEVNIKVEAKGASPMLARSLAEMMVKKAAEMKTKTDIAGGVLTAFFIALWFFGLGRSSSNSGENNEDRRNNGPGI